MNRELFSYLLLILLLSFSEKREGVLATNEKIISFDVNQSKYFPKK